MLHPDIKARKNSIEGRGLFAVRKIPKGTIVWKLGKTDRIYTQAQVKSFSERYKKILKHYGYFYQGRIVYLVDDSKYFNHSCDANVVPFGEMDIAMRDIMPGDEVTYDYGFLMDGSVGEKMQCHCGSKKCRVTIVAFKNNSAIAKKLEDEGRKAGKLRRRQKIAIDS